MNELRTLSLRITEALDGIRGVVGVCVLLPERAPEPGWRTTRLPDGRLVRIDFESPPTLAEWTQIEAIVGSFDIRSRKPKGRATLAPEIGDLNSRNKDRLVALALADFIARNPEVGRSFGIEPEEAVS